MTSLTVLYKPPEYGDTRPENFTLWMYPFRDMSEREKDDRYRTAKDWRWFQELAEVPILEDYSVFCNRVARDLEL